MVKIFMMLRRRWLWGLLILCIVVSTASYLLFQHISVGRRHRAIVIVVSRGALDKKVAHPKHPTQMHHWAYRFLSWGNDLHLFDTVLVGEYVMPSSVTLARILQYLRAGRGLLHKAVLQPGWDFCQVMRALESNPYLSHTLAHLTGAQIMAKLDFAPEVAEGSFYPDTYLFTTGTKDSDILKMAHRLMQKKLQYAWQNRDKDVPYKTAYEALIVASLIEKEAMLDKERPLIAGVILRRLKIGMRLQIDASVLYGANHATCGNKAILMRNDLHEDTPYNTYMRYGLPPTPIAMPGEASIWAALHPVDTGALYYVVRGDGGHVFSRTFKAHERAVSAYRKMLHAK